MASDDELTTTKSYDTSQFIASVISAPLLEDITKEDDITRDVLERFPNLRQQYNAAIFLNESYEGGLTAALAKVRKLVKDIDAELLVETPSKVDDPDQKLGKEVAPAVMDPAVIRQLVGGNRVNGLPITALWPTIYDVIIDVNLEFQIVKTAEERRGMPTLDADPRYQAKLRIATYIDQAIKTAAIGNQKQGVQVAKTTLSNQYVFASLEARVILKLLDIDLHECRKMAAEANALANNTDGEPSPKKSRAAAAKAPAKKAAVKPPVNAVEVPRYKEERFRAIHHIWPDFQLSTCIFKSSRTIKADAAQNSFTAFGERIVWGVIDSGIDATHPHFRLHENIDPHSPMHADFTDENGDPLNDKNGHGTHVAGIIAGEQSIAKGAKAEDLTTVWQEREATADSTQVKEVTRATTLTSISGMAPKCKLVSLKVLNQFGNGNASSVIAAICHVQMINGHGRDIKIHGVNLSLGHSFDPKWFACGHSPLCVEVNRLVRSGVVVVIAAGNSGYGTVQAQEGSIRTTLDLTINDPGNAEEAITVGSTHRNEPFRYGVSFFSSKGPTGDGRYKPDIVAPGEKIVSCAAANSVKQKEVSGGTPCLYLESSGTSMAAPHVSGAIAAFLSIRPEFIGESSRVKKIFVSSATDLGRDRYFQGAGLVDLLRAIQSV